MNRFALALFVALAACGPKGTEISVAVSGVTMADLEGIKGDLSRLRGVSSVRVGELKDGRASFSLTSERKGGELAADLAGQGSNLRKVTAFDDASVTVAWEGKAAAAAVSPSPTPAQAPPAAPKEIKVDIQKDPLAYKVHQLAGGTVATFDGWKVNLLPGDSNWAMFETHPEGKENDFQMIVAAGTPEARVQSNLFEEGPKFLQRTFPALQAKGEAKPTTIGGDEARVQDYTAVVNGRDFLAQSVLIKKKDVAVSLLAFGTPEAMKEFGRAVGITAQSITVKESPPDAAVVGTWALEKYYSSGAGTSSQFSYSSSRSITIYPNGTFTEVSSSNANLNNSVGRTDAYLDGGDRGRVVKRGPTLSFHYDNGKVWNAEYKLDGGALVLNGNFYLKQ